MKISKEKLGKNVNFERIRRITGYLVGSLDTWNNAKKAEEHDRVKHGLDSKNVVIKENKNSDDGLKTNSVEEV